MEILSPYGKDVDDELSRVYGIQSLDELQQRVKTVVHNTYGLNVITIETLHVAFCMCMKLATDQERYYLKFLGKTITKNPDELFHFIKYLREHGLPLPEILPTKSGTAYFAMLPDSSYDKTFLMTPMPGPAIPCNSPRQIQNFATMLAKFHHLGEQYANTYGEFAAPTTSPFISALQNEQPQYQAENLQIYTSLLTSSECKTLTQAFEYLQDWSVSKAPHLSLPKTQIHGDIRMCHVFQEKDAISGIIDFDQSSYTERLIDICFGVISAPTQNDGKTLDVPSQQLFLTTYHKNNPLTDAEQDALHPYLLWANLEQFWDLCRYHIDDPLHVTRKKLRKNIEEIGQLMRGDLFKL